MVNDRRDPPDVPGKTTAGDAPAPPSARAPARDSAAERQGSNLRMLGKLALLATLMFGFGWAMIPLYNAICEATGIRVLTKRDEGAAAVARNTQVDTSRTITIEFDTNIHGTWKFIPEVRSMRVHPGELMTVEYELSNTSSQRMAGQAIPSYAPTQSARHFHKVQCFCFEQQTMEGHEVRRFPVVFLIDPELPKNIDRITLSYTYFDVGGMRGAPQVQRDDGALPPGRPAASAGAAAIGTSPANSPAASPATSAAAAAAVQALPDRLAAPANGG